MKIMSKKGEFMEQDLRVKRTNKMLCDALIQLLGRKRFEDITIQELCDTAMIRRATFYTHFIDKYDFFAYFVQSNRDGFASKWKRNEKESMNEFLIFMFEQMVLYINEQKTMVRNIISSNAFPILMDILSNQIYEDVLIECKERSTYLEKKNVNPSIIASFYSGGFIRILQRWLLDKNHGPQEKLIKEVEAFMKVLGI